MMAIVNSLPSACTPPVIYQCSPCSNEEIPSPNIPQKIFRTRTTVNPSSIDAGSSPAVIFYDTFYDNLESLFSRTEWEQSLLKQKIWLINRQFESGDSLWILKIHSLNENGVLKWFEIFSEEKIKLALESHHIDTPKLPPLLYSVPLMRVRVARLMKSPNHWIAICGGIGSPTAMYAVSSTNITPPFPKPTGEVIPPSKTKVMLYFLNNAAFRLAFTNDADRDTGRWIISEENPAFSQHDKFLKLKDASAAYIHSLPFNDEDDLLTDSCSSSEEEN